MKILLFKEHSLCLGGCSGDFPHVGGHVSVTWGGGKFGDYGQNNAISHFEKFPGKGAFFEKFCLYPFLNTILCSIIRQLASAISNPVRTETFCGLDCFSHFGCKSPKSISNSTALVVVGTWDCIDGVLLSETWRIEGIFNRFRKWLKSPF